VSGPDFTPEQLAAIERREGSLLVRAGAGTGKTSVLVERFVRAVLDDGEPVESILAITFTEKAAAEMRTRVRRRFVELGRRDEARDAEGAWISTIHGFCSRVLRAHALSAGIDPDYRVLDALESERVALDAFDRALADFLGQGEDPERLEMAAAYSTDTLREMVRAAYSLLRSRGERRPRLELATEPVASGERERLQAAAAAALQALDGAKAEAAIARLERCGAALGRLAPEQLADPAELKSLEVKGRAKVLAVPAVDEYREALAAYAQLCTAHREYLSHNLLRVLLELFGDHHERLKRERSGLDFEDLELVTRDLLAADAGIRAAWAGRFSHVLVDEFQDTNPLQNELLELLSRDNLFRVGDENQSIYGFRNADVRVFREHHDAAREAGRAESVTVNFRSRGEVLDAIDLTFSRLWGEAFEPLRERPGARGDAPAAPSVELIVVDRSKPRWDEHFGEAEEPFGAGMRSATAWRALEARLLAKRIDELTGDGPFEPRDVVLLMRATTHMSFYERALEERGVPTHVVGGRGYWTQQQVADLRNWLAALANPLDELALYSVLASPLVGASLDAVALLGLHARRSKRDPWWILREPDGLLDLMPDADRRAITRFADRFERERAAAPRVSLETLIDRAVTTTGYDAHVLALPAGDRRMANVRKLMRMAREYESREGRDLRGFIDFVAERDLIQDREGEAPLEAEELDAVRLMTVHRAKGLEFPVVCVADLGKGGREDTGSLRISNEGEVGLRLASMSGGKVDTAELERIKTEQKLAGEEEERRIFYVAATRAEQHLILSGATDLETRPAPQPLGEPMAWAWRELCPGLPAEGATGIEVESYEGREVRVRWTRCVPDTVDELLPAADLAPARPAPVESNGHVQVPLEHAALPAPRALPVSRLSYSAIAGYERCSYRFYLQRALNLPGGNRLDPGRVAAPPQEHGLDAQIEPVPSDDAGPADEPRAADELSPLLRGSLVHQLLEALDFGDPQVPDEEDVAALIERNGAEVRGEEVADLIDMVARFTRSELCARLGAAGRVRAELPFSFTVTPPEARGRSVLMNGVVDVHAAEADRTLIVDYKSDPLEEREPADLVAEGYELQRLVYALAALRAGAERAEVAYVLLERPDEPVLAEYEAADADRLESELLDLARGIVAGRFEPTEAPHRELCADCPGQPALCSWPPEMTLRG
jgi:ATP-dependent exoDNAse (exonuclease V) beta subunit